MEMAYLREYVWIEILVSFVRFVVYGILAVSPPDYARGATILMFDTCDTRKCVDIQIVDDNIEEGTEIFTATLERTPGLDPRITLDPDSATVEITNDDGMHRASTLLSVLFASICKR